MGQTSRLNISCCLYVVYFSTTKNETFNVFLILGISFINRHYLFWQIFYVLSSTKHHLTKRIRSTTEKWASPSISWQSLQKYINISFCKRLKVSRMEFLCCFQLKSSIAYNSTKYYFPAKHRDFFYFLNFTISLVWSNRISLSYTLLTSTKYIRAWK